MSEIEQLIEEIINEKIDMVDELKNRLSIGDKDFKLVDKSFFKRVFSDVTDVECIDGELIVSFGRGVFMSLDGYELGTPDYIRRARLGHIEYRWIRIISELVDLGLIFIKTSPFRIFLKKNELYAEYYYGIEQVFGGDIVPLNKNIHDNGYNCWGGWGGIARSSFSELKMEQTIMTMIQRMRQLNIEDISGSMRRINDVIKKTYLEKTIELDPLILARLIVEYDVQQWLIDDYRNSSRLDGDFIFSKDNKLYIGNTETNIDLKEFMKLLETTVKEYVGPKPKAGRDGD